MGKVMPKYDLPKPGSRKPRKSQGKQTSILSGVARPEASMGKVIIMRAAEVAPVVAKAPKQAVEAPKAAKPAPMIVPSVVNAVIPKLASTPAVTPAPAKTTEAKVAPAVNKPVAAPKATKPASKPVVKPKGHASAAMAKAAGPQELRTIEVNAAPFRTERFVGKGLVAKWLATKQQQV